MLIAPQQFGYIYDYQTHVSLCSFPFKCFAEIAFHVALHHVVICCVTRVISYHIIHYVACVALCYFILVCYAVVTCHAMSFLFELYFAMLCHVVPC